MKKAVLLSMAILILCLSCYPKEYQERDIHLSMAGRDGPWEYLTKNSTSVLMALHEKKSLPEMERELGLKRAQLQKELDAMVGASLVTRKGDEYSPGFFCSNLDETLRIYDFSKKMGTKTADYVLSRWREIEDTYAGLEISRDHPFDEMSMLLVGSKILDVGVLQELVQDGTLLKPAPRRPGSRTPDGMYYFWMAEGQRQHLGVYGQDDTDLPDRNWHFVTFGANSIDNRPNQARNAFEKEVVSAIKGNHEISPAELAGQFSLPLLGREDSLKWRSFSEDMSRQILVFLKERKGEVDRFFNTVASSRYSRDTYGDFYCWFYHLVYSHAIDHLIAKKKLAPGENHFAAMIHFRDRPEGVLTAF
jgi:hypothetical protein